MKDRVLVAILALGIVVNSLGAAWSITQVSTFADDLRASAVEGCKRQNAVRKAQRHALKNDIEEGRAGIVEDKQIPPRFFPDIPPGEFDELIRQGTREARQNIAYDRRVIQDELQPAACEAVYPQP